MMRTLNYFIYLFLAICALPNLVNAAPKPAESVLLSSVQSLTLRHGLKTSHRRVAAVPQLQCVGGSAKGLYNVDVMRCKNQGTDYDDDNVQWTCTAALPPEFKLGSTDVICEGYDSPNDPYVLKGSCGVEYRLILTDRGEEKYGPRSSSNNFNDNSSSSNLPAALFWMLFVAVVLWMLYAAFVRDNGPRLGGPPRGPRWGGGGGGGGGDDDDPPPPYDDPPQPKTRADMNFDATRAFDNWRPGFWTGAAGGAAAGYLAGNRNRGQTPDETNRAANNNHHRNNDPGVGSSTRPASSFSTTRYESTGFGTSSRR